MVEHWVTLTQTAVAMQTWQNLLLEAQNYKALHPEGTLVDLRAHLLEEPIVVENRLTFSQAKAIDDDLFGESENEYWLAAYHNPNENDVVTVLGEACRATSVGVFTFSATATN